MARNTTLIRSNYLWDESARIYEHALKLWEGLEEDLDYPILFSQRGVLNLAHSLQDVRDSVRRVEANKLNGIDAQWVDPDEVKKLCPIVNISNDIRYPVLGATYQPRAGIAKHDYVAWGFARRADEAGIDIIQNCEVTGFVTDGDRVTGVRTTRGDIGAGQVALCAAGHTSTLTDMLGIRTPVAEPSPSGAGLRTARAGAPDDRDVERRARLRISGAQGRTGDGRRRRLLQRVRPARRVPHHRAPDGRRRRAVPRLRPRPPAAHLGRHRRRLPRRLPHRRAARRTRTCTSTPVGAQADSRRHPESGGVWPTRSPTTSRTSSSPRSASTDSSPARWSTNTAPPASRTEPRSAHPHRSNTMQLIECPWCGPREETEFHYGGEAHVAYPEDPQALTDEQWAHYVFFRSNPKGLFAERWSHSAGCRRWFNAVRDTATYRFQRRVPPGRAEADDLMNAPFRTAEGGRVDARHHADTFTFNDRELTGHAGDTLASALLANGVHQVTTSIKLGRPRGFTAAWAEDTGGLVQIEHPFPEPMLLATTVELFDGLVARGIPGQGRLAEIADTAKYDAHPRAHRRAGRRRGTGRSGRRADRGARRRAGRAARRTERSRRRAAGQHRHHRRQARAGLGRRRRRRTGHLPRRAASAAHHRVRPLRRRLRPCAATAHRPSRRGGARRRQPSAGVADPRPPHRGRRGRPRASRRVHRQRPAGHHARQRRAHLPAPLRRQGRRARPSCSPPTTAPTSAAFDLHDAGVRDQRDRRRPRRASAQDLRDECAARGITIHPGSVVSGTRGEARVTHAIVSPARRRRRPAVVACDVLLVSGGWNPAVHLFSQARGKLRYDDALGAFVPGEPLDGGQRRGLGRRRVRPAGLPAQRPRGGRIRGAPRSASPPRRNPIAGESDPVRAARRRRRCCGTCPTPDAATRQFVDVQRDATVADLVRAVGAGMRSMEHIKRYTTIGTAHDQGKTSGVVASGITSELLGAPIGGPRRHHVPAALHAGGVRRARRPQPRPHVRSRSGSPRCTTGTSTAARCSRTSASGSVRATTRCRARTWRPRCCANVPPSEAESAFSTVPPSARSTCRARTRASSSTCSTRT